MTKEQANALQPGDRIRPFSGGQQTYTVRHVNRDAAGCVVAVFTISSNGRRRAWGSDEVARLTVVQDS